MNKIIAILGLLVILALMNWSIYQKEQHLAQGQIVKLKLAPVDPRSLMQGDYMALRFELAQSIYDALRKVQVTDFWSPDIANTDGLVIVQLDDLDRASFSALDNGQDLETKQHKLQYRIRNGQVKFATNAFFFEEGSAELYSTAEYGEFRVNKNGEVLLTALLDKELKTLNE